MKTVAVVTATTGRKELQQAMDSVAAQTYPCEHYIFVDGVAIGDTFEVNPTPENKPRIIHRCWLPVRTGGNGMMNGGIVAASAFLVQEDLICWLDDDNWFEPDHIEKLVEAKGDKPYAYSLRALRNSDGSFFANDDFESIGHHGGFIDLNCYLMERNIAVQIAPLWYKTTGELMIGDRFVYQALRVNNLENACSGLYSLNYRLNEKRDLRGFFFEGNIKTRAQFPDGFPWAKDTK
jgi:glycosyltransferase involved in cell wall biosynthesis